MILYLERSLLIQEDEINIVSWIEDIQQNRNVHFGLFLPLKRVKLHPKVSKACFLSSRTFLS